jgi:hypothetical protein
VRVVVNALDGAVLRDVRGIGAGRRELRSEMRKCGRLMRVSKMKEGRFEAIKYVPARAM